MTSGAASFWSRVPRPRPRAIPLVLGLWLSHGASSAWAQTPPAPSEATPTPGTPPVAAPAEPSAAPEANDGSSTAGAAPDPNAGLVPPKLRSNIQPEYPARALELGLSALVVLELDIDATGLVENATVVQGADPPGYGFEEAALAAAKLLLFEPATEGGKPVPVRILYRLRFVPPAPATALEATPAAPPDAAVATPPAAPAASTAEQGGVSGILLERGTRLPLSGVKVTIFRGQGASAEGYETHTDASGRFELSGLGVGEWRLLADPAGYYPVRTVEEVRAGSRTEVRYAIERGSYNPYDVQVSTTRLQREVNHIAIDARQAERIPGTFGDVLAVVNNFPGVARVAPFSGGPFGGGFVIRGSAPKDSRIFVASVDVPLLYHFGNVRSVLPSGLIETVNFYPGNFSVQYGRATGGIVDVELRDLARTNVGGYADVNVFDTSVYFEVPVSDKLSFAIAGRRSYIDVILEAALGGGVDSLVAPRYYDAQFLATYRPAPAHRINTFLMLSDDRFEVVFNDPLALDADAVITDVGLQTNFYRGLAEYTYVPNARFENDLKLSFGRDRQRFNFGQIARSSSNLHQGQLRDTARYAFSDQVALRGGLDYLFQRRRLAAELPDFPREGDGNLQPDVSEVTPTSSSGTYHSIAGFAELELRPWPGALALPGVRYDHFTRTGQSALSPRVVLRQSLSPEWTLKGGIGSFQQEPAFEETDPGSGNPRLRLERAIHYSAGAEYEPLPFLSFDLTGFYKKLDDVVGRTDAVASVDGASVPLNYDNGASGRVLGLELMARHQLHDNLFAWVAYTLSKAERKDPGSARYRPFDFDQTHILTLIGSYRLPRNWEVGARFRYVTGNLYTPVTGGVYDSDADEYVPLSARVNSARVAAFHQLDVRIDKRWVFESWMLNAYLDIQNVYNRANVDSYDYNYDYSEAEAQQGLPVVPILGLRGEF
jgi:TonB family protein